MLSVPSSKNELHNNYQEKVGKMHENIIRIGS